MMQLLSLWGHTLAATLYAALTLSLLRDLRGSPDKRHLATAFAATAVWMSSVAVLGPQHLVSQLLSSGHTFAFLGFMYAILRSARQDDRQRAVKAVYFTVAAVIGLQITIAGVIPRFAAEPRINEALESTAHLLGFVVAAGCLILAHNVYGQAAPESRASMRLTMIGLAAMWFYQLHLNTVGYLSGERPDDLQALQGVVLALIAPVFALGSPRNALWRFQLSRAATFQSISVLAIFAYLLVMMSAARLIEVVGGTWVQISQLALVLAVALAMLILLPSGRARAWLRVMATKHLFQHRYDYREEWLRFTRTMSVGGGDAAPIEDRIAKAIAELADSQAALLLVPDEQYRLTVAAGWNWPEMQVRNRAGEPEFARFLERSAHVVEFSQVENGLLRVGDDRVPVPTWMTAADRAWAGIPLIHNDRLVGIVLIAHPLVRRVLDWEDYDLFRTSGNQAASYLAEARSHHALADSQRFDEFNRRFAFIMHDIKNVVSQLSLVARNAERHADNPEFRADMVVTLQSSVRKMNDLLARIAGENAAEAPPAEPLDAGDVVAAVAEVKRRAHPVEMSGERHLLVRADRGRLEQALTHLIQNAIDASPRDVPVRIATSILDGEAAIEISDRGVGMSAEFIRTRLFQPFASTKEGGFGIGAFEAKTLIGAIGGRLEVESREGEGSRFTIFLQPAEAVAAKIERMRA